MARYKLYDDVDVLQRDIDAYFEYCDANKKPYTMTGLALSLGMDRRSLVNYANDEKFFLTIKEAKQRVELMLEEQLYRPSTVTGLIFNLKNNFGWAEEIEVKNKELSKVDQLLNRIEEDTNDNK